ncbi:fimbria/pilus outer membrane usher protein [Pragia fontium]|uniref:fimbria/pilus outer membrane usher protein n=1 Tax=Pragia fontium TaxID=82985 RepID=UPI00069991FD|nr:fimbria/pilus outer membrane usher protein [Pragia fontium]
MQLTRSIAFASCWLTISMGSVKAQMNNQWVIVNNLDMGQIELEITDDLPCLKRSLLETWGVKPAFSSKFNFTPSGCLPKDELDRLNIFYFNDASVSLTIVDIPQTLIESQKDKIDISSWSDGVNALFVNYHLNYAFNEGEAFQYQENNSSTYVELESGLNLDAWRLRHHSTIFRDAYGDHGSYSRDMYLARDIKSIGSSLVLGDANTPSNLFKSLPFRGIMLKTDEKMLPDSWRSFSPWLKGFANSNAEITVRQNGTVIYQTFVPPGAFILRDVSPPEVDGDLEMTIKESNGTETVRSLPYTALPNLVHSGNFSYQTIVGTYKPWRGSDDEEPRFTQVAANWGLPGNISLFGGGIKSDIYQNHAIGLGKNLNQWGAISIDYSQSKAQQPRRAEDDKGGMYRLRYAKAFFSAETSLMTQFRYYPAGQRYRDFDRAITQQKTWWWDWDDGVWDGEEEAEKRYRWEVNLNRNLTEKANVYLTLYQETYRKQDHNKETSISFGFSDEINDINYNVYASYNRYPDQDTTSEINVRVSIPLNIFDSSNMKLNYSQTAAHNGSQNRDIGISGYALENYSLGYQLGTQHDSRYGDNVNGSIQYQHNAGQLSLGATKGGAVTQYNADIEGSLMAHAGGITLGQSLGETMGLVEVTSTKDVGVNNQFGVTTDSRGYALVSYLTPYRENTLSVDDFDLPEGMTMTESSTSVIPTRGAVVFAKFTPDNKQQQLIRQSAIDEAINFDSQVQEAINNGSERESKENHQQQSNRRAAIDAALNFGQ